MRVKGKYDEMVVEMQTEKVGSNRRRYMQMKSEEDLG